MRLPLTAEERGTRAGAAAQERRMRVWRRSQALRRLGAGRHRYLVGAANRAYAAVDEPATRAVAWRDDRSGAANVHTSGVQSPRFAWLPT